MSNAIVWLDLSLEEFQHIPQPTETDKKVVNCFAPTNCTLQNVSKHMKNNQTDTKFIVKNQIPWE